MMFALVIGINKYPDSYPNLNSAVGDADKFERFLAQSLGVLPTNIQSLRDDSATRAAIIDAFKSFTIDPRIEKDDPIIIYYAGHGGRVLKPIEWSDWVTNSPQIEIMCSTDIGTTMGDDAPIAGIPDRTISALLRELSSVKGDNITLILDCCSSAGMSRAIDDGGDLIRQIPDPPAILPDCDVDIWGSSKSMSRGAGTYLGFAGKHQESHVLLAACGVDQYAVERPRVGGLFTSQLLHILNDATYIHELTYISLMNLFKMPSFQTPHCEGLNIGRRLFNKTHPGATRSFLLGYYDEDGTAVLRGGNAHGVTLGSVYGIHASNLDPGPENPQLCTLVVVKVDGLLSLLGFSEDLFGTPTVFYARKLTSGPEQPFSVHCTERKVLENLINPPDPGAQAMLGFIMVDNVDSADLSISVDSHKAVFDRGDPLVTPHIGTRIPFHIAIDDIDGLQNVIHCAMNLKRHLRRTGENLRHVWLELRELELGWSNGFETATPTGPNILDGGVALAVVDRLYGLTIFNQTDLSLYPHVFFLDPSELSISAWYTPPMGSHLGVVDPPLPPKSVLTLGYGDTATDPWTFGLRPGEEVDVGFLKVFFTTSPSDFSSILQNSPFPEVNVSFRLGLANKPPPALVDLWGTKMATIVHKKG